MANYTSNDLRKIANAMDSCKEGENVKIKNGRICICGRDGMIHGEYLDGHEPQKWLP